MTFQTKLRAMNRRRFVPSTEGLEGRALQASTGFTLFGVQLTTNLNVPITYQQKAKRIEHLPYYLGQIHPGRFLPQAEIQQIQGALFNMMDSIQKPDPQALNNFNYEIRPIVSKESLSSSDIAVLTNGVARYYEMRRLQSRRSKASRVRSTHSPRRSTPPASCRYTWQRTTLRSSCKQPWPSAGPCPRLSCQSSSTIPGSMQDLNTSRLRSAPILVGTYHFHTAIQVVTPEGVVVGQSFAARNNNYRVQITTPQPVGVHEFRLQAVDTVGHISRIGPPFLIKVVPKKHHDTAIAKATPKGPLASAT